MLIEWRCRCRCLCLCLCLCLRRCPRMSSPPTYLLTYWDGAALSPRIIAFPIIGILRVVAGHRSYHVDAGYWQLTSSCRSYRYLRRMDG
ncbi:hypothetical protein F5Y14DRAFT_433831 [Nemania sp. NC0429]|nr:hypothetical protein F5Y14DRAFT_433831 [Nemania sp. NC0429]